MRHHLPVIARDPDVVDRVEIPTPCTVPWDAMRGDDAVRHCGACKQNVYNLSSFTRVEAVQLLTARSGRVCLRIFRRPDGTVVTADCRARLRAARRRGVLALAGVLLVVLWAQVCAQVFGWVSLRRLVRGPVMGEAPPPLTEVAPPADQTVRTMGLMAPPGGEVRGKPVELLGKRAPALPRD
jgi:hypothetical protein